MNQLLEKKELDAEERNKKKEVAKQYIKASLHYGHSPKEWNPKMAPYILTSKYNLHVFDLVKTTKLLNKAGDIAQQVAERKEKGSTGIILFVGTNKVSSALIANQAGRCGAYHVNYRWLGGNLTNWSTVQEQIARLKFLENEELQGKFESLSKKEYSTLRKEMDKKRHLFNGIKDMPSLPELVIFTCQSKDKNAIKEATRLGIPSICIVDSNGDPDLIPYPIPANDDSSSSVNFILSYLVERINIGNSKRILREEENKK